MPLTDNWLSWLGLAIEVLSKLDWLNVLLIGSGFIVMAFLMVAQLRPGDGFDMRSLVATRTVTPTGRDYWTVTAKAYQFGGFMVTTWGFISLIGKGALSDLYLTIYAAAWLASPAINQIVASKFPVTPGTALPEPQQQTGTVNIDITQGTKP